MSNVSTLILYKQCKIELGKNFMVDNIADYLSGLTKITINNFQYQKHALELEIKIDQYQYGLEGLPDNNYNYVSIQNFVQEDEEHTVQNGKLCYYFIKHKKWRSQNTLLLSLVMDTINTFKPSVDFTIDAKTHINREHKDRFKLKNFEKGFIIYGHCSLNDGIYVYQETFQSPNGCEVVNFTTSPDTPTPSDLSVSCTYTASTYTIRATYSSEVDCRVSVLLRYRGYERQIDTYAEGLNPILYKKEETFLETADGTSWNLIYKNNSAIDPDKYNQVNAVSCYLVPDSSIPIKIRVQNGFTIEPTDLADSTYYYFTDLNNDMDEVFSINFSANDKYIGVVTPVAYYATTTRMYSKVVMIEKFGASIILHQYRRYSNNNELYETSKTTGITQLIIHTDADVVYASDSQSHLDYKTYAFYNSNFVIHQLDSIENVDKTESTIIKIIKLPYAPNNFKYVSGYFEIPINWDFDNDTGWLKLTNMNSSFINEISSSYNPIDLLKAIPLSPAITDVRNDNNESKQYMSEFFVNKAVYDSFNYPIELEKIQAPTPMDDFKLNFVTTKTINSRFLFDFKDIHYKFASQDYENIMAVARNNEVTIYSNQFINYLRTGYNYDVKNKERSDLANEVGMITNVVGNIASVGLGALSGNVPVAISSSIGATSSIVNSIISSTNAMAQNEANMEQKIAQYKSQATAVSGSDDLDLMIYYSKNLLKFAKYSCSDKIKSSILDLFYYGGYATDEMKTPNLNTRAWFNFLSCELIADTISFIPEEILQDIIVKYSQGVTILHKNIISSVPTWDFEQIKENWEVSLL